MFACHRGRHPFTKHPTPSYLTSLQSATSRNKHHSPNARAEYGERCERLDDPNIHSSLKGTASQGSQPKGCRKRNEKRRLRTVSVAISPTTRSSLPRIWPLVSDARCPSVVILPTSLLSFSARNITDDKVISVLVSCRKRLGVQHNCTSVLGSSSELASHLG